MVAKDADGTGRAVVSNIRANPLKTNGATAAGGADANRSHNPGQKVTAG
jgi:hypothetical protein